MISKIVSASMRGAVSRLAGAKALFGTQAIDQRTLYEGNSVLRGQEPKVTTRQVDANVIR
jgi:hypothetical protein